MRRTALICSLLLSLAGSSFAATAEEMWQDYQQKPAIVSNNPTKQAEPTEAESSIDTSQAEETAADNNIVNTAPTVPATPKQEETAAEAPTTVNEAKAPMAEVPTTPAAANTAAKPPVISNEPVPPADKPKPKPKLNLVGKPPLPRQFMRTPQASDFTSVSSEAGGYIIAVPKAFGENPLGRPAASRRSYACAHCRQHSDAGSNRA